MSQTVTSTTDETILSSISEGDSTVQSSCAGETRVSTVSTVASNTESGSGSSDTSSSVPPPPPPPTSSQPSPSLPPATQEELQSRLKALMNRPDNQICCDCSDKKPTWATLIAPPPGAPTSTSQVLGAFCCFNCTGAHRGLGTHICFVRSINLDTWKEKEVIAMELGGNKRVNAIFEAKCIAEDVKPTMKSDVPHRTRYVQEKYNERLWYEEEIYNTVATIKDAEPIPKSPAISLTNKKKQRSQFSRQASMPDMSSQQGTAIATIRAQTMRNNFLNASNHNHQEVPYQEGENGEWDPFADMKNDTQPPPTTTTMETGSWHPGEPIQTFSDEGLDFGDGNDDMDDDFSVLSWKDSQGMKKKSTPNTTVRKVPTVQRVLEEDEAFGESMGSFGDDDDGNKNNKNTLFGAFPDPTQPRNNTKDAVSETTKKHQSDSHLLTAEEEEFLKMGSDVESENESGDKGEQLEDFGAPTTAIGEQQPVRSLVKSSSRVRTMKSGSSHSTSSSSRRAALRKTLSVPVINTNKTSAVLGRVTRSTSSSTSGGATAKPEMKLEDNLNESTDDEGNAAAVEDCNDLDNSSLGSRSGRPSRMGKTPRRMLRRDRQTSDGGSQKPDPPTASSAGGGGSNSRRSRSSDSKRTSASGHRSRSSGRKMSLDETPSTDATTTTTTLSSNGERSRSRSRSKDNRRSALSTSGHRRRTSSQDATKQRSGTTTKRRCSNETEEIDATTTAANTTSDTTAKTSSTTSTTKSRTLTPPRSSVRRSHSDDLKCFNLVPDHAGGNKMGKTTSNNKEEEKEDVTASNNFRASSSVASKTRRRMNDPLGSRSEHGPRSRSRSGSVNLQQGDTNFRDVENKSDSQDERAIATSSNFRSSGSVASKSRRRTSIDPLGSRSEHGPRSRSSRTSADNVPLQGEISHKDVGRTSDSQDEFRTSASVGGKLRRRTSNDPLACKSEHNPRSRSNRLADNYDVQPEERNSKDENNNRSRSNSKGPRTRITTRPRSVDASAKIKGRRAARRNMIGEGGPSDPPAAPPAVHPSVSSGGGAAANRRLKLARAMSVATMQRTREEQEEEEKEVVEEPSSSQSSSSSSSFGVDHPDPFFPSSFAGEVGSNNKALFAEDQQQRNIHSIDTAA